MRKDLPQKLLRELLKNSRQSDRDLAKILKVSQPTITRIRHKLERNRMIQDYTIIPNFKKMGFEILAITFIKMRPEFVTRKNMDPVDKYAAKFPNVIFVSTGEGLGMTLVIISFEKSYSDYHRGLNSMRVECKDCAEDIQSFVVSVGEGEFKRFSLTHLKDVPP